MLLKISNYASQFTTSDRLILHWNDASFESVHISSGILHYDML